MKTEIQFSIIYPSHTENDINQFEFFIRMAPADGKTLFQLFLCLNFLLTAEWLSIFIFA